MTFVHTLRVRYGEVDMQGVVFNAQWLVYFDDAVTRWFDSLGFPPKSTFAGEFDFMLVRAEIDWKAPVGFYDDLAIEVVPARLGNASFDVRFRASVDERPACEATVTYVSIEPGRNRSRPIPPQVRERLEADLET